ncbi:hypothetical protein NE237_026313 [Protea cynaroides]|uniref:Uncharacterized protein n=1 Tax=Protea cynaroides TaxID=273540 RepID=A0A9Q0H7Y8_9MAGN|nr:hypothetical protein NE237_026313 [Protea cynaroides]
MKFRWYLSVNQELMKLLKKTVKISLQQMMLSGLIVNKLVKILLVKEDSVEQNVEEDQATGNDEEEIDGSNDEFEGLDFDDGGGIEREEQNMLQKGNVYRNINLFRAALADYAVHQDTSMAPSIQEANLLQPLPFKKLPSRPHKNRRREPRESPAAAFKRKTSSIKCDTCKQARKQKAPINNSRMATRSQSTIESQVETMQEKKIRKMAEYLAKRRDRVAGRAGGAAGVGEVGGVGGELVEMVVVNKLVFILRLTNRLSIDFVSVVVVVAHPKRSELANEQNVQMEYPLIHNCRFAIGDNPCIPRAHKVKHNGFLCCGQLKFKFNSFIRWTSRFRDIRTEKETPAKKWNSYENSSDSISDGCIGWLRWFSFPLILASGISSIYLFSFNLSSEAHVYRSPLFKYACEDVSNYYAHAEKKKGQALKKELHSISSSHQSLSYEKVWDALKILDAADINDPDASSDIVEIYSLRAVSKSIAGKLEGWNREHLWPRSYGLTYGPSLTDLHNIRPADVNVNSSRGNKYFGECLTNSTDCMKPANKEAASDTETDKKRWAPPFEVRGDIARAIMYMAVRYGFHQPGGSPILHLSDSPSIRNREMGLLSTLLKWNRLDPPSKAEHLRNDRVCMLYQHNRNPFIDHPEYANLIWNQSSKAWKNKFHYSNRGRDQTEFVEIIVGPATNTRASPI